MDTQEMTVASPKRRSKTPPEYEVAIGGRLRDGSPEPYTRTGRQRPLVLSEGNGGRVIASPPKETAPVFTSVRTPMSPGAASKDETETLNRLINQLLEESEKGTVSQTLISRIQNSPLYASSPFAKELLSSVIHAQKSSTEGQSPKMHSRPGSLKKKKTSVSSPVASPLRTTPPVFYNPPTQERPTVLPDLVQNNLTSITPESVIATDFDTKSINSPVYNDKVEFVKQTSVSKPDVIASEQTPALDLPAKIETVCKFNVYEG